MRYMWTKFIKNAKNGQFWRLFENFKSNSVTRQVTFIRLKSQNAKIQNATF